MRPRHRLRSSRRVAVWLLGLKGGVEVEHYRPDMLLDAEDFSMEDLFDIVGHPGNGPSVAPENATSAASMLV